MLTDVRSTTDPVAIVEIAERLGVPVNRVVMWSKRGNLPDPHWIVAGRTKVWDWDELTRTCPIVQGHAGTRDWSHVVDALPRNRKLMAVECVNTRAYNLQTRISGRTSDDAEARPLGWVSIPLPDKQQLLVTDDPLADGLPIQYTDAVRRVRRHLVELRDLRKTGDHREPTVSRSWSTSSGDEG